MRGILQKVRMFFSDKWSLSPAIFFALFMAFTPLYAEAGGRVAYVYSSDTASRDSFTTLLTSNGFQVDTVTSANAATFDFSPDNVIIIGSDTGTLGVWNPSTAVNNIKGAGKPVLGIGGGGASFFSQVGGLFINWGQAAGANYDSITVSNPSDPTWLIPNLIPNGGPGSSLKIYSAAVPAEPINTPSPVAGVTYIGGSGDPNYTPLIYQVMSGNCYEYWAYYSSPASMTITGQQLFVNVVSNPCDNTATSPFSWWPGDGSANDIISGNNGTLNGGMGYTTGISGQAFNFDGVDDYVSVPSAPSLDPTAAATLGAWVYFDQLPSAAGHFMQIAAKAGNATDLDLQAETDNRFHFYVANSRTVVSTTTIQTGVWYYVAATYTANSQIQIYINGALENTTAIPGVTRGTNGNPFTIGKSAVWPGRFFKGRIDEVMLFGTALPAADIQAIYNSYTNGLFNSSIVPTGVAATSGNSLLTITWNPVSGAAYYNIYRSTTSGVLGSLIGWSDTTSYTDLTAVNGATYFYSIKASDGIPMVYVANESSNNVSVIDSSTNTIVATVPTNQLNPGSVAVNSLTGRAYVTNYFGQNVSVVDTTNNSVLTNIGSVGTGPASSAVNPLTNMIYISSNNSTSHVIDGATNNVTANFLGGGGVVVYPEANRWYVGNNNSVMIDVRDTVSNNLVTSIPGFSPWGMAVNPLTNRLYASNYNAGTVAVIDTNTNTVIKTVTVGSLPKGVAVDPQKNKLYVNNYGGSSISVIDTITNTVVTTITVGANPNSLAISPQINRLYSTSYGDNSVYVIDTTTNSVVTTIGVGVNPKGLDIYAPESVASSQISATPNSAPGALNMTLGSSGKLFYNTGTFTGNGSADGFMEIGGNPVPFYQNNSIGNPAPSVAITTAAGNGGNGAAQLVASVSDFIMELSVMFTDAYYSEGLYISARYDGSAYDGFKLYPAGGRVEFFTPNSNPPYANGAYSTTNTWYKIKLVGQGSAMQVYVNNMATPIITASDNRANPAGSINIVPGLVGGVTASWYMDDFRIFKSYQITVNGLKAGQTVELYDSANIFRGSGIVAAGQSSVNLDVSSLTFPFSGFFNVYDTNGFLVGTSQAFNGMWGGDVYNTSYTITASAGPNGSISPSGATAIAGGSSQTFTITPASGHHIADVLVDGASVGAVPSYTFSNVTASHTISASFAYACPVITFSPGSLPAGTQGSAYSQAIIASGGTGPYLVSMNGSLPSGMNLQTSNDISGTPALAGNYSFTLSATDSKGCTGSQSYTLAVASPVVTPAAPPAISPVLYTLTISKSGSGSVMSMPSGISCGGNCTKSYDEDETVTLQAVPDSGYIFSGWTGCDNSSGSYCTVTMKSDMTVTAGFDKNTATITPPQPGETFDFGTVKVGKLKNKTYKITNSGKGYLTISAQVTGNNADMFSTKLGGKKTIRPKGSYGLTMMFKPKSTGPKTATLKISTSDPGTPTIEITLTGAGK